MRDGNWNAVGFTPPFASVAAIKRDHKLAGSQAAGDADFSDYVAPPGSNLYYLWALAGADSLDTELDYVA